MKLYEQHKNHKRCTSKGNLVTSTQTQKLDG